MKKRATLNDIAQKLNLTKVSVSKALRDHPDISEATKIKAKNIAEELGYRPNLIAKSLTSSKTRTLGVVVPKIAHNFFAHVVAGIQQYANMYAYEIVLTVSEENEKIEKKHIEALISMQVEGLLVSVSMESKNTDVYKWVRELELPLVFFDRNIPGLGFNSVIIDDKNAAKNGVLELIKRGHTNIAHLAGLSHINIGHQRQLGYEEALKESGMEVNRDLIVEGGFGEESGYKGFKELIRRNVEFDSLFAVTFPVGLGSYMAMHEINPKYIDKYKMLAFGDSGIRGIIPYPHYYVDQPGITIGKRAAELLLNEINGKVKPQNHIEYIPTRFLETGWDFSREKLNEFNIND